ncbi:DUF4238 domain-containing protein [Acidocella aromatica]|uniref:DUF4238 domain-containing protein n=1 Tax=Acidocella aromatica TaxID=1303579 RepID=A0A840VIZ1_9PROT|nr:DUF4238 domain-containing protein [Acidocella aromatica]MBB5372229.1 hypothetical protein [Acidocella aromatica]
MNMKKDTRRQHHVWRSYLEAWSTNQTIFCLMDSLIFPSNVSGVGVERDFYKLSPLTSTDIQGIRWLFEGKMHPSGKRVRENFLTAFGFPGWLLSNPPPHLAGNAKYEAQLRHQIINVEEDWHAALENKMTPVIAALRRRETSVYTDDKECIPFLHFLCLQMLRTKGVRDKIAARTSEMNGFSIVRCWNILRHIFAVNAGLSLYLERKKRSLLLLENNTDVPFITGDQPVVNLFSNSASDKPPELFAPYYPLNPSTALIIDEVEHRCGYTSGSTSVEQVRTLNRRIREASYRQVFSNSKEVLQDIIASS